MLASDLHTIICIGDTVLDHMDDTVRVISGFRHNLESVTVHLEDGGVMALSEIHWDYSTRARATFATR
jgi:hypothetical protein